jgi:hypothetical protein
MLRPSSARARRRLLWVGALLAVVAGAAGAVALLPHGKSLRTPVSAAPVRVPSVERKVPVSAADRRAIDAVLDRFVPTAVTRRNPAAGYALAAGELRAGTTRADWAKGDIPVYPYDARGRSFHDWRVNESYRNAVNVDLMLRSRHPRRVGPIIFKVDLKRIGGRWLVAGFQPAASLSAVGAPAQVVAATDFGPTVGRDTAGKARLGAAWLVAPAGIAALLVLVPLLVLARGWRDGRRYRAGRGELPPLPRRP